jgi:plastocyanin
MPRFLLQPTEFAAPIPPFFRRKSDTIHRCRAERGLPQAQPPEQSNLQTRSLMMKVYRNARPAWLPAAVASLIIIALMPVGASAQPKTSLDFYLPDAAASKIVTVARAGRARASITVMTEAVAVKETGSKKTVAHFGEVYAFSPSFIAVHRDEPTSITLWNLQPDDEHDFTLIGPSGRPLMYVRLSPLTKTSYLFTFHKEGLFNFHCLIHQPEMSGQILVLAPQSK